MRICIECGKITDKGMFCSARCGMKFRRRLRRDMRKVAMEKKAKRREEQFEEQLKKRRWWLIR